MNRKTIIYTRVSTDDQKENGFSLPDQENRLRKFCRNENNEIVRHYQDDHSAKDFKRPAFQKMLLDIKEKRVSANLLLCVRMDRFSRNVHESLNMIKTLKGFGLDFNVIEGQYDLDTPENLIPFILNMLLPQVENERRGINTKRGMRQANREGKWTGTPPKGYKWTKVNDKSMIMPNESAKLVTEGFMEFSKGIYSMEEVRRKLLKKGFKCSKNQFTLLLRNPFYIGKIRIKEWKDEPEEIVRGLHNPLTSEATFNRIQNILNNRKKGGNSKSKYNERLPLRGFLQCKECGSNLTGSGSRSRSGDKHFYYHCQNGCKERYRADEANSHFINYLKSFNIPKEILRLYYHILKDIYKNNNSNREQEINSINNEIAQFNRLINSVEDNYFKGMIDIETYNKTKSRYKNNIDELSNRKLDLNSHDSNFINYVKYGISLFKNLDEYYLKSNIQVKHKLIGSIFPEKLIYEQEKYRTSKINEALSLITSNINAYGDVQNKNAIISDGKSYQAPAVGLEPNSIPMFSLFIITYQSLIYQGVYQFVLFIN